LFGSLPALGALLSNDGFAKDVDRAERIELNMDIFEGHLLACWKLTGEGKEVSEAALVKSASYLNAILTVPASSLSVPSGTRDDIKLLVVAFDTSEHATFEDSDKAMKAMNLRLNEPSYKGLLLTFKNAECNGRLQAAIDAFQSQRSKKENRTNLAHAFKNQVERIFDRDKAIDAECATLVKSVVKEIVGKLVGNSDVAAVESIEKCLDVASQMASQFELESLKNANDVFLSLQLANPKTDEAAMFLQSAFESMVPIKDMLFRLVTLGIGSLEIEAKLVNAEGFIYWQGPKSR
jgi:hypothetical protein